MTPRTLRRVQLFTEGNDTNCVICLEDFAEGDHVSITECNHRGHVQCLDVWCATSEQARERRRRSQLEEDAPDTGPTHTQCPVCRQRLIVAELIVLTAADLAGPAQPMEQDSLEQDSSSLDDVHTPRITAGPDPSVQASPTSTVFGTPQSYWEVNQSPQGGSAMPWWPATLDTGAASADLTYHTRTQLTNGQRSVIVDPGAWTNLMGENLARQLSRRAVEAGHRPQQVTMERPLSIQGVGSGTQQCTHEIRTPIAITDAKGQTTVHSWTAPIVRESGAGLPGLLGLRSLESMRAVLDMGHQELILPGRGDTEIVWPSGTVRLPLHRAPSGHLVLVIDDFERALQRDPAGLPDRALQLHSRTGDSETETGEPATAHADPAAEAGLRESLGSQ